MMKVVRDPSMQMERFDRPVRSVNCYDNDLLRVASSRKTSRYIKCLRPKSNIFHHAEFHDIKFKITFHASSTTDSNPPFSVTDVKF